MLYSIWISVTVVVYVSTLVKSNHDGIFSFGEKEELHNFFHPQLPTHPCDRKCIEGDTVTCLYRFTVEKQYTMSQECKECPDVLHDCYSDGCIPTDGIIKRPITTVNGMLPGPKIEVCKGDLIIVTVINKMDEPTSIHWHGHNQKGTPYMDGVPFITQCPIEPGTQFDYKIRAENHGTLFWHSHSALQRASGMFGAFIVRVPQEQNPHKDSYDHDLSDHIIIINDWTHQETTDKYEDHIKGKSDNKADTILVNGGGRFYKGNKPLMDTPMAVFDVKKGQRYRFRLINSGVMNCPVETYIDKHNVTVIASDGHSVDPVIADSFVSYAGERWDFVVLADKEVGNYWIRFTGLMDCDERFTSAHQVAVLHYEGAPEHEPYSPVGYGIHPKDTLQLNPLNKRFMQPETISVASLCATNKVHERALLDEPVDMKFYINYDFNLVNNPVFYKDEESFQKALVSEEDTKFTPQLKHVTFKWPPSPLLSQVEDVPPEYYCSSLEGCEARFCHCTHVIKIPLNKRVEIILVDEGKTYFANHPFHLHGFAFRVLGTDRLGSQTSVAEIEKLDKEGKLVRNLDNPPFKDTVTVPDGGYTILRFHANNPGYWLFHCHLEYHLEQGMALVFKIGEDNEFPQVPFNFPTCGMDKQPDPETPQQS